MSIKNLASEQQPREKATTLGFASLSDIELLALFLGSGVNNYGVLRVAQIIFEKHKSLSRLAFASISELEKTAGIGPVKALKIKAIFELNSRFKLQKHQALKVSSNHQAAQWAIGQLASYDSEGFLVLFLGKNQKVLYSEVIYKGTKNGVSIDPLQVITIALKTDANSFYCFHNHPSGIAKPSAADRATTRRLRHYGGLFGIELKGHIIVTSEGKYCTI